MHQECEAAAQESFQNFESSATVMVFRILTIFWTLPVVFLHYSVFGLVHFFAEDGQEEAIDDGQYSEAPTPQPKTPVAGTPDVRATPMSAVRVSVPLPCTSHSA